MINRRRFIGLGTAAAATASLQGAKAAASPSPGAADSGPRIRRTVTLGRTGLQVSDVSFGSSSLTDADLVRYAFDRGVNFFDTAESYRFGSAEEAIGEALHGVRDKVVISSKTKAGAGDNRREMMEALEGSLRRLRTDYVDIYFNHAVNDVARMRNPEWREFTERAKEQGKIRFRGMSGHGSQLVPCLHYAIDQDLVDVVLVAYNFGQDPDFYSRMRDAVSFPAIQPDLPEVLDKAKRKNVGVIAMKTLMGARLNDMRPHEWEGATFAQAAFRWVLSSPRVDALLISMNGKDAIDEYLAAPATPRYGAAISICWRATPTCRIPAIAATAATDARARARRAWRSPRCCGPACTTWTMATIRWPPWITRAWAPTPARARPVPIRPVSARVPSAFPSRT